MAEFEGRTVAIIGAGPAGLYAAKKLANAGCRVTLINRDLRPGGLAEYGIFYNKYRMKRGLRRQYARILDIPEITYRGGVTVSHAGPVTLAELKACGFDAYLVATGAQGVKWIRVEGSHALGVYDAKQVVFHYNGLPPFSQHPLRMGSRLAIIGAGNVAVDIAHWAIHEGMKDITLYVRRGPSQRKYTDKELSYIGGHIDREALQAELRRLTPQLHAIGEDLEEVYASLTRRMGTTRIEGSDSVVSFRFACQAARVRRNDVGAIAGLTLDENNLYQKPDGSGVGCRVSGERRDVDCDMLVFAVGDAVDPHLGLEVTSWGEYAVSAPAKGAAASYSVAARPGGAPVAGWFVVGWARKASDGLVGKARKDAERGCEDVLAYLAQTSPQAGTPGRTLDELLSGRSVQFMDWASFKKVRAVEERLAKERGLEDFRFTTDDELRGAL